MCWLAVVLTTQIISFLKYFSQNRLEFFFFWGFHDGSLILSYNKENLLGQ